jgi:hypothetical protein
MFPMEPCQFFIPRGDARVTEEKEDNEFDLFKV